MISFLRDSFSKDTNVFFAYIYLGSLRTSVSILQSGQVVLTSLCAITRLKVPAIMYGFAQRLKTLVSVSAAEFVCIVENTKCQVIAASIAVSSVSKSRISQTIMISGSCLIAPLSPDAKVNPISALICAWLSPIILISTGSS